MHYDQSWMGSGIVGGLEAGAISLVVALLLFLLLHRLGHRHGWSHAHKIGWSFLLASVLTVSGDPSRLARFQKAADSADAVAR